MESQQTVKHRSYLMIYNEPYDCMKLDDIALRSKDKYEHILKKLSQAFGDNFNFMAFQIKLKYPKSFDRFQSKQDVKYYNIPQSYEHNIYFSFKESVNYWDVKDLFIGDILNKLGSGLSLTEEPDEETRERTFGCNREKPINELYYSAYKMM